ALEAAGGQGLEVRELGGGGGEGGGDLGPLVLREGGVEGQVLPVEGGGHEFGVGGVGGAYAHRLVEGREGVGLLGHDLLGRAAEEDPQGEDQADRGERG